MIGDPAVRLTCPRAGRGRTPRRIRPTESSRGRPPAPRRGLGAKSVPRESARQPAAAPASRPPTPGPPAQATADPTSPPSAPPRRDPGPARANRTSNGRDNRGGRDARERSPSVGRNRRSCRGTTPNAYPPPARAGSGMRPGDVGPISRRGGSTSFAILPGMPRTGRPRPVALEPTFWAERPGRRAGSSRPGPGPPGAVGRIRIRAASGRALGFGTGSLVGPRLLLTNHHVLPDRADRGGQPRRVQRPGRPRRPAVTPTAFALAPTSSS